MSKAAVERWADKLDAQTDARGIYIHYEGETLPEKDAWGNPLTVSYSKGGLAEKMVVRSFGKDGISHTDDDIVAERGKVNLSGVGAGAAKGVAEFTKEGARGAVHGVVSGVRESVSEIRKSKAADEPTTKP